MHTVGYVSVRFGTTGIESSMNSTLTGHADYSNWRNALYSLAGISTPGSTVALTLNSQMQASAENALRGYVGAIVVLDPQTGAILAKASSPTFTEDDLEEYILGNSENAPLLDRTTDTLYAPGSSFKVVTLSAVLDTGTATLDTIVPAPPEMTIGNAEVSNYGHNDYGEPTLREALALSSNTAFGSLGAQIGPEKLVQYARAFGYGTAIGQDFSSAISVMPNPEEMTEWETAWAACGQPVGEHESPAGPQTTVMQNAVAAATVANKGVVMNPYVVDHVLSPEGTTVFSTEPSSLGKAMSSETAERVGEAMLEVVSSGTGTGAFVDGYLVAGKTGTAQVGSSSANSLFCGFAPYDDPQIAVAVAIEKASAGADLAPVAVDILNSYFSRGEVGSAATGENTLIQ
jgi:peptidoglycan glycosyltransferase